MIFGYTSATLVSINWLPTAIACTIGQLASLLYYTRGLGFHLQDVFLCFCAAIVVISYSAYTCEKKMKQEFLLLKYNQQMHKDIREVLEKLPEGILLINPKTQDILLSNNLVKELLKCADTTCG